MLCLKQNVEYEATKNQNSVKQIKCEFNSGSQHPTISKFRKYHPTVFVVGLSMLPLCQHTQLQGPEVLLTQPWDCHGSLNERELS